MNEEEKQEKEGKSKNISKHEFFFEIPLYSIIKEKDLEEDFDEFFSGDVDAYVNGLDTTYIIKSEQMYNSYTGKGLVGFKDYHAIKLVCKRKGSVLYFFILNFENYLIKVGQYLSLADLQNSEISKKYNKILLAQDLRDLKKAIGLSAHGVGAGSLVYLRRIFENIIWDTYEKNNKQLNIEEDDFKKKRMNEKVTTLKDFLPEQLVEMKNIYGVLSKGIHELSEEECLAYFPALKLSIELILDQKIEKEIEEKKNKNIKSELAEIVKKLS